MKHEVIHVELMKHVMKYEMYVNEHDVRLIVIAMTIMCVMALRRVMHESANRELHWTVMTVWFVLLIRVIRRMDVNIPPMTRSVIMDCFAMVWKRAI